MIYVEPAPHEFAANLLFNDHGLKPWFGADRAVKDGGGSQRATFEHEDEEWWVNLYYQESGIEHPGLATPNGTPIEVETLREFRLAVSAADDPAGQRKLNAHLAPRWPGMKSTNGKSLSPPEGFGEGVNVRVQGSNIEFERYPDLLRAAAESVGIHGYYFSSPHHFSNVQDAALYVRLHKQRSGPIHARDGPIASMGHLLENDRRGYRKVVQNDDDERGENLPGYYHTVTLGPRHIREAFPHHKAPKEIKHYYAREALNLPDSDPLAHPKLEAAYQVRRWDYTVRLTDEHAEQDDKPALSLRQLRDELEEALLGVLADANIPIRPGDGDGSCGGNGPYIRDDYFRASEVDDDLRLVSLDLTEIRADQESVVIKHLADGLSPVEWDALQVLVTDGGTVSPADIADAKDRHVDSVRRALNRMPDLVETSYGSVALQSEHIANLVHEAVEEAKQATRRAVEAAAKGMEAAERGLEESASAFIAWAARHGIDVDDSRDARLVLRMGGVERVGPAVREGFELWKEAGMDPIRYRQAQVNLGERGLADAWRYLGTGSSWGHVRNRFGGG